MRKQLLRPFKSFWQESYTKAWAYTKMGAGAACVTISEVNGYITDPTFKSYLEELDLPKYVSIGLIILGMVTYIAHGRKDDE